MKCVYAFAAIAAVALTSCGKDSEPVAAATSAQTAPSPTATATQSNTNTNTQPQQPGPGSPVVKPPSKPVAPGTPDATYCPVVELSGNYGVANVACTTDGKSDKVDAAAVPQIYLVTAQGDSGMLTMKVGAKTIALTFPRSPDPWLDYQKNGTQCSDGPNKSLTQRCPGVKDSSCIYSLELRAGKLEGVFSRVTGSHTYECRSDLVRAVHLE